MHVNNFGLTATPSRTVPNTVLASQPAPPAEPTPEEPTESLSLMTRVCKGAGDAMASLGPWKTAAATGLVTAGLCAVAGMGGLSMALNGGIVGLALGLEANKAVKSHELYEAGQSTRSSQTTANQGATLLVLGAAALSIPFTTGLSILPAAALGIGLGVGSLVLGHYAGKEMLAAQQ